FLGINFEFVFAKMLDNRQNEGFIIDRQYAQLLIFLHKRKSGCLRIRFRYKINLWKIKYKDIIEYYINLTNIILKTGISIFKIWTFRRPPLKPSVKKHLPATG